jgi:hypothetical protein
MNGLHVLVEMASKWYRTMSFLQGPREEEKPIDSSTEGFLREAFTSFGVFL